MFKRKYVDSFKSCFSNLHCISNTIGIHYRMNDKCFNKKCSINMNTVNSITKEVKTAYKNNITLFISTVNSNYSKIIANGYKYYEFMAHYKPIHISKVNRNITDNDILKVIGDILLVSSAKYLILTRGSTFSYLILSIYGINYLGEKKNYSIIDERGKIVKNGNLDIIEYEMNKYKCFKAVYYSVIK